MLQVLLALDRGADVVVALYINQSLEIVALCETFDNALAMLPYTASQIAGDADIKRSIGLVCENVDPSALHMAFIALGESALNH